MKLSQTEYKNLIRLLSTESPSSCEDDIAEYIEATNSGHCLFRRDEIGNTFLSLSTGNRPHIMLSAHVDEIGLQVTNIIRGGFVRFRAVGGIDSNALVGRQVHILHGMMRVPGVICKVPIHVELHEKNEKPVDISNLWIDIGCSTTEDAENLVSIGDMISFAPCVTFLGEKRLSSKALDNKIGVFIALSAIRRLASCDLSNDVTAVFTAQEEVGGKGAAVAAEALHPALGICIDTGVATDCPDIQEDRYGPLRLGDGPALVYCTDTSRRLTEKAAKILSDSCVAFQKSIGLNPTGGTDTLRIQMASTGIPCILYSIPIRSMHTASEVCDLDDISAAIEGLVELLKKL